MFLHIKATKPNWSPGPSVTNQIPKWILFFNYKQQKRAGWICFSCLLITGTLLFIGHLGTSFFKHTIRWSGQWTNRKGTLGRFSLFSMKEESRLGMWKKKWRKKMEAAKERTSGTSATALKASFGLRECRQHGDVDADGGNNLQTTHVEGRQPYNTRKHCDNVKLLRLSCTHGSNQGPGGLILWNICSVIIMLIGYSYAHCPLAVSE